MNAPRYIVLGSLAGERAGSYLPQWVLFSRRIMPLLRKWPLHFALPEPSTLRLVRTPSGIGSKNWFNIFLASWK
jgi:hypothetical protein